MAPIQRCSWDSGMRSKTRPSLTSSRWEQVASFMTNGRCRFERFGPHLPDSTALGLYRSQMLRLPHSILTGTSVVKTKYDYSSSPQENRAPPLEAWCSILPSCLPRNTERYRTSENSSPQVWIVDPRWKRYNYYKPLHGLSTPSRQSRI